MSSGTRNAEPETRNTEQKNNIQRSHSLPPLGVREPKHLHMRATFIALLIACLSLSTAVGQSAGNAIVKGFLRSKPDNQPLPFSAVMLQNPKDSSVAYSAISNDKGFFQIAGISDGEYRFVATYLGYTPL